MTRALARVDDTEMVSLAVHEAGHAVVATLAGLAVRYTTIAAQGGGGLVQLRPRRTGIPGQDYIAVLCAGMIAEDVAGTDERWRIAEFSDAPVNADIPLIRDAARRWHAVSNEITVLDLIARSWTIAFDLVVENYGAVLDTAKHLLANGRALTGPQIRACIDGAPTVRPDPVPADGRSFWVPTYSRLRNWGPAAPRRTGVGRVAARSRA